jgi:mitosis inhibitor protein kinase SWE1
VDFTATEGSSLSHPRSGELVELILHMMRSDPDARLTAEDVYAHAVVQRAREAMARKLATVIESGAPVFGASPLGGEPESYMEEVLQLGRSAANAMDLSP